ncbi:MAG: D-aminoacyl-tRNA deacylase [Oscillospiraceae bacterium]|nr:D-aminoacyl-tRNA deacylase [Oscillospiraceae bacterium]
MKIVLQRVTRASVTVNNTITGKIDKGYVVLLGVGAEDDKTKVEKMVDKIKKLRIFPDENGKTNLSVCDAKGSLLVISQFTLYADCKKGNRPSFTDAANPVLAEKLYNYFIEYAKGEFSEVESGIFGAMMEVELINDGPFTIILED